jgi:hypothetical protein
MGSATFGRRSQISTRLGTRNSLCMLVKNLPAPLVPGFLPFILAGQLSRLLVTASTSTFKAHLKGLAGALRLLPLMLEKRREIQKNRRVPVEYVRRLLRESNEAADASLRRRLAHLFKARLAS